MPSAVSSPPGGLVPAAERPWLHGSVAVGAAAALGFGIWAATPTSSIGPVASSEQTVAHQRALAAVFGCLLTESRGVAVKPASEVWAGLQDAADAAGARVMFLPLSKAGTPVDQVNALVAQRCTVVVAVGAKPTAAVSKAAAQSLPDVRFAAAGRAGKGAVHGFEATRVGTRSVVADLFAQQRGAAS